MLIGSFEKSFQNAEGLLEFLHEFLVLLIAPRVAQADHLPVQRRQPVAQLAVEVLEMVGKTTQLDRIDNRLRHERLGNEVPDSSGSIFAGFGDAARENGPTIYAVAWAPCLSSCHSSGVYSTSRALAPLYAPTMPSSAMKSMSRAARP